MSKPMTAVLENRVQAVVAAYRAMPDIVAYNLPVELTKALDALSNGVAMSIADLRWAKVHDHPCGMCADCIAILTGENDEEL